MVWEDSSEHWADEGPDDLLVEVEFAQALDGGDFGLLKDLLGSACEQYCDELSYPEFVADGEERIDGRKKRLERVPLGVDEAVKASAVPDECAGIELAELQRVVIERGTAFGIGSEQH